MSERKRRRTCLDRGRLDLAERQRQCRGGDPAGKVMLRLLGILSGVLAMIPPIWRPRLLFPTWAAKRPVPSIDDDRGPTAYAMERGIEPHYYAVSRVRPVPSWSRLVKDLSRSRKTDQARELLEARVPTAAMGWLREAIETGDLWRLRMVVRPGASDDEIAASMLAAAQIWELERQQQSEDPDLDPPDDDLDNRNGPKS